MNKGTIILKFTKLLKLTIYKASVLVTCACCVLAG